MPVDPLAPALVVHLRLLEVAHVAHRLSCSPDFVRTLIDTGQLPALRLGPKGRWRIDPRDLETYLEACRTAAKDRTSAAVKPFPQVRA
jgi:excisionase family DNA binding protein